MPVVACLHPAAAANRTSELATVRVAPISCFEFRPAYSQAPPVTAPTTTKIAAACRVLSRRLVRSSLRSPEQSGPLTPSGSVVGIGVGPFCRPSDIYGLLAQANLGDATEGVE